ncbi:UDP-glucosyltransferase 2-like isoform X2 [Artemia franciscana]
MFTACLIFCVYFSLAHTSKILVVQPLGTKSHLNSIVPLINELVNRGHHITYLNFEYNKNVDREVEQLQIKSGANGSATLLPNLFEAQNKAYMRFDTLMTVAAHIPKVATEVYETPEVQQVIWRKYDLVIFAILTAHILLPVATENGTPFIIITPNVPVSGLYGVEEASSYVPNMFLDFVPPLSFTQRTINYLVNKGFQLTSTYGIYFIYDGFNRKYFPKMKPLSEQMGQVGAVFTNSHVVTAYPMSLHPGMVEIGGVQCREAEILPKDLEDFIDEGKDGFILLSLGSAIPMKYVPEKKRQALFNVFSKLSQQVFIKWDGEAPSTVPSNVKLLKWAPQQDLLGHSNIRLFVTHGGLYSLQEAIFHSTPVIGIPVGNDQGQNLARAEKEGYAKVLTWEELDENTLGSAINEVLYNESYKINAERLSNIFRDQPETPLQRAVYWIEYIIRHKGAHHLKHPGLHLPWYQTSLFDVLLFLGAIVLIIVYINFVIARRILQKITRGTKTPVTKNKKKQ